MIKKTQNKKENDMRMHNILKDMIDFFITLEILLAYIHVHLTKVFEQESHGPYHSADVNSITTKLKQNDICIHMYKVSNRRWMKIIQIAHIWLAGSWSLP